MSTAVTGLSLPPRPPGDYRLTVYQYEQMAEAGILTEDDNVELLNGLLVRKMAKAESHTASCTDTRDALLKLIRVGWYLRVEAPIRIPDCDEPEPDLAVVRGKSRDYVALKRLPLPAEVTLAIEVAESSLQRDRTDKLRDYAQGGIPVYWIINLVDRQVEVYTQPEGGHYLVAQVFKTDQSLTVVIGGAAVGEIPVADIVP
ncbi:MAG: Uma2 family endonuclease [Isosphaeraceae bacterium]